MDEMLKTNPKISVIMPAYNVGKYIQQAIDSILQQTYQNWELLIGNDASNDDTARVIAAYHDPRIKVFTNEKNLGSQPTRNFLFERAEGNFIALMDADDICLPSRLERQVAAFQNDPKLGIVGTWATIVNRDRKWMADDKRPVQYHDIMRAIYSSNPFLSPTVMVRSDVYKKIGGYREELNGYSFQDYDWTFLIAERFKAINLPEILYEYRQHDDSISKTISIKKRVGEKLVQRLALQRIEQGADCIQSGNVEMFNKLVEELSIPYKIDQSLLYQESAVALLYAGLAKKALRVSWRAVCKDPFKFRNYRTLKYAVVERVKAVF
jgi:glycosyltransferase involved in cell wall biosynthesis